MISGVHVLVYAEGAGKARAFFRDVMGWPSVDAGHGWLIFALPPGEIAAHPAGQDAEPGSCELYLMCDDLKRTVAELRAKGVEITRPARDQAWGIVTAIDVPGLGTVGLYQPKHPIAHRLGRSAKKSVKKKAAKGKAAVKKKVKRRR